MSGIRLGLYSISAFKLGGADVKVYLGDTKLYPSGNEPCFEVVDALSAATGNYVDVYNTTDSKWYKKNNLSQYEEYGIMPEVADLSTLTYYTGKLAVNTTDNHEYKWNGSSWTDLGSIIQQRLPQGYTEYEYLYNGGVAYVDTGYKPNQDTRIIATVKYTSVAAPNANGRVFGCGDWNGTAAIHCNYEPGSNGTLHGTWGSTTQWYNASSIKVDTTNAHTYDMYDHYLYMDGNLVWTFPTGNFQSTLNLMALGCINGSGVTDDLMCGNVYSFKMYDGQTLIRDFIPAERNSDNVSGLYDIVNDVFYTSPNGESFTKGGSEQGTVVIPEDYQTKVAPADYVTYSTLAELELMECPWIGMHATVGNELYIYTSNGWVVDYGLPCFEVVDALSAATGNYVDVYNTTDSKWYKKNNLSQYEEYGIRPEADSLSGLTYYTGKLAVNTTDNHEYKHNGTDWVDIGEVVTSGTSEYFLAASNSSEKAYYYPGYYFGDGYHVELDISFTTWKDMAVLLHINSLTEASTSPIEFTTYQNGFYNDFHAPQSTTDNSCYTGDYSKRNIVTSTGISPLVNRRFRIRVGICDVKWYDYETGTQLYSNGSIYSGYNWYNGLYIGEIRCSDEYTFRIKGFKVYDSSENLVNDIEARYRPGTTTDKQIYFHDNVLNVDYENVTENPVGYYEQQVEQVTIYPEDYNTKVAPPDNVVYSTLEELELMECPWIGMHATVGGVSYIYTANGWEEEILPTPFISVDLNGGSWQRDDYISLSDYYRYSSNNDKALNGYKLMKVEWVGIPDFSIFINSNSYSSTAQYLVVTDMDADMPTSILYENSTGVKDSTYNTRNSQYSIDGYKEVSYPNDGGEHHLWVMYRQSSMSNTVSYANKGFLLISKEYNFYPD